MTEWEDYNVVFDLDGTLTNFYSHKDCLLKMYDGEFFLQLQPLRKGLDFLRQCINANGKACVWICSIAHNEKVIKAKKAWIKRYIPEVDKSNVVIMLSKFGNDKSRTMSCFFDLSKSILIDDYTPNLLNWRESGGIAIKALNGINNTTRVWKGQTIEV